MTKLSFNPYSNWGNYYYYYCAIGYMSEWFWCAEVYQGKQLKGVWINLFVLNYFTRFFFFFCLHVCLSPTCISVAKESSRPFRTKVIDGSEPPYGGVELWSLGRSANTLNSWAISLALKVRIQMQLESLSSSRSAENQTRSFAHASANALPQRGTHSSQNLSLTGVQPVKLELPW